MNKLKKGLVGFYYLLSHPKTALYMGFLKREHGRLYTEESYFRDKYKEYCISLEDFFKKNELSFELVELEDTKTELGSIRQYEIFVLCSLVRVTNAKTVFEIGTFKGRTTRNISRNISDDGMIYTLDINQTIQSTQKVISLCGDSVQFNFTPYFNKMDIIFIDGNHNYEYVSSDSENAYKCVKAGGGGGFIIWHDFDHDQLHSVSAIINFCKYHNLQLNYIDGTALAICKKSFV